MYRCDWATRALWGSAPTAPPPARACRRGRTAGRCPCAASLWGRGGYPLAALHLPISKRDRWRVDQRSGVQRRRTPDVQLVRGFVVALVVPAGASPGLAPDDDASAQDGHQQPGAATRALWGSTPTPPPPARACRPGRTAGRCPCAADLWGGRRRR
jgi:hypothetical protein